MRAERQIHSGALNEKVAIEALEERKVLCEFAKKYEMHPYQIVRWNIEVAERAPQLF